MIGALAGGLLAGQLGVRPTLLIAALGYIVAPVWCLFSPVARLRTLPDR